MPVWGQLIPLTVLVAFVGLLIFLPWMFVKMIGYTTSLFGDFSRYAK